MKDGSIVRSNGFLPILILAEFNVNIPGSGMGKILLRVSVTKLLVWIEESVY
jgi:hypothetical protein